MVELRKRPPPKETATDAPAAKRSASKPRAKAETTKTNSKAATITPAVKSKVAKVTGKAKAAVRGDAVTPAEPVATNDEATKVETGTELKDSETKPATDNANSVNDNDKTESDPDLDSKLEPEQTSGSTESASTPLTTTSVGKFISADSSVLTTEIQTHTSQTLTLSDLVSKSSKGVIIFTYPRASTPGCTTQACLFRDNYTASFKSQGWDVYGLSNDSPKANTGFVTKQSLTYELLCDVGNGVVRGLGFGKAGGAKGAVRGVVGLRKAEGEEGKGGVKVVGWMTGGPQKTLDAALEWVK